MTTEDMKSLKELALLCREVGILKLKGYGLELELTLDLPEQVMIIPKTAPLNQVEQQAIDEIQTSEELSDSDLLFWSSGSEIPKEDP